MFGFFRQFGGHFVRRTAGRLALFGHEPCPSGQETDAVLQLPIKQALRIHAFRRSRPKSVPLELAPVAERPVLRHRRLRTIHHGGLALPNHRVRSRPACSLPILTAVAQIQRVTVHPHVVEQGTRCPGAKRSAETIGQGRKALHKGVGPCGALPEGEIMKTLLSPTTLKQIELPVVHKCVAAIPTDFRHRLERFAVLHRNLSGRFQRINGRSCEMPERDPSHPTIFHILQHDGHPAVVLIFYIG